MKATFSIENIEAIKQLEVHIRQLPNVAEGVMNEYIHTIGAEKAITNIKEKMPCSKGAPSFKKKKTSKGQARTNAKYSDSLKAKPINLGFIVETTNNFWYLVFPALGTGNSYKYMPNDFMNKGINATLPTIIDDLTENLAKKMEDNL